jgi:UPF0755 protein
LTPVDDRPASDDPSVVTFTVRPGATAASIGDDLQRAGLIRSALAFRITAESRRISAQLQTGEFELRRNMTLTQIQDAIASGRTARSPLVTIPEGWRAEEIAQYLETRSLLDAEAFMRVASDPAPVLELSSLRNARSLEGYLFPDSYDFSRDPSPEGVVRTLVAQFEQKVDDSIRVKAAGQGLSVHGLVTLASIIEREAVDPDERPLVSAVFHNRLERGMPLQADPTTQYALVPFGTLTPGLAYWKRELTQADLRTDSAYNTYRSNGLPPGPICNPGLASIEAAANPAARPFLYFVAKGDGTHLFAETLDEHNRNVSRVGR